MNGKVSLASNVTCRITVEVLEERDDGRVGRTAGIQRRSPTSYATGAAPVAEAETALGATKLHYRHTRPEDPMEIPIDDSPRVVDDESVPTRGVVMTSMWKRGSQCQYHGTAITAARLSGEHRNALVLPEQLRRSGAGSPTMT